MFPIMKATLTVQPQTGSLQLDKDVVLLLNLDARPCGANQKERVWGEPDGIPLGSIWAVTFLTTRTVDIVAQ